MPKQKLVPVSPEHAARAWVLIPFGFDLEMLVLHMLILAPAVAGFFVTEATTTFQGTPKPLLLREHLATLPPSVRPKVATASVDLASLCGTLRGQHRVGCFEETQRQALVGLLKEHVDSGRVAPSDLAIVADSDEISNPVVVRNLTRCMRLVHEANRVLGMLLTDFHGGLHCNYGDKWTHGPKISNVSSLLASDPEAARFLDYKVIPYLVHGGWHFSSFGTPSQVRHKLRQWGHANLHRNQTLSLSAIRAGMLNCSAWLHHRPPPSGRYDSGIGRCPPLIPAHVVENFDRHPVLAVFPSEVPDCWRRRPSRRHARKGWIQLVA